MEKLLAFIESTPYNSTSLVLVRFVALSTMSLSPELSKNVALDRFVVRRSMVVEEKLLSTKLEKFPNNSDALLSLVVMLVAFSLTPAMVSFREALSILPLTSSPGHTI